MRSIFEKQETKQQMRERIAAAASAQVKVTVIPAGVSGKTAPAVEEMSEYTRWRMFVAESGMAFVSEDGRGYDC